MVSVNDAAALAWAAFNSELARYRAYLADPYPFGSREDEDTVNNYRAGLVDLAKALAAAVGNER